MPKVPVCPKCGSDNLARAHRKRWFDRVVSQFGVFPFRCGECGHRFSGFDTEALWMDHTERRAWLTSGRGFWLVVALLLIALLMFYNKLG